MIGGWDTFESANDIFSHCGRLLWITSLDPSKTCNRADWECSVSPHVVWILRLLSWQLSSRTVGAMENSTLRQACNKGASRVCSAQSLSGHCPSGGRNANGVGYDFHDGGVSLLDVRFADGILMFLKSREEIGQAFDMLVPPPRWLPTLGQLWRRANIQQDSCGFGTKPFTQMLGWVAKWYPHKRQQRTGPGTPSPAASEASYANKLGLFDKSVSTLE